MINRKLKRKRKKSGCATLILVVFFTAIVALVTVLCFHIFGGNDSINDKVNDIKKIQYPKKYSQIVEKYSDLYGVDDNLVYAVIRTESHFKSDSESGAGAKGLMQITPECFEFLQNNIPNEKTKYKESDLYDPEVNIKFGTYFLSYLLDRYDNVEKTAVAAYNAGFGAVDNWLNDPECSLDGKTLSVIVYPETENYVEKVENAKKIYIEIYKER